MNELRPSRLKILPYVLVVTAFGLFVAFFAAYHERLGDAVAALAIIPITVGSWYFGVRGGVFTATASILSYTALRVASGPSFVEIFAMPSTVIGAFALFVVGLVSGRLATLTRERRDAFIRLAHSNNLIYSLLHVTIHIEKALSPDEIAQSLSSELQKINIAHAIALYEKQQGAFKFDHTSIEPQTLDQIENSMGFPLYDHTFTLDQLSLSARAEDLFEPIVVTNPEDELSVLFNHKKPNDSPGILMRFGINAKTVLFRLPLMLEEDLLGILWIWGNEISASDLPVMSIFAKQIGISLERARLFQEVQSLAITDHLTGLHNRRSLFELGRIEFSRAERFNRPFCCLMLDLDHFKQINDTYGHQTGDKVLQEFARRCKDSIREIDLIGRYGGEELIILMPETEIETATQVAERLRSSICDSQLMIADQKLSFAVSIGVATKDENTLELETLIARADQAMYIAKHRGRNRIATSK